MHCVSKLRSSDGISVDGDVVRLLGSGSYGILERFEDGLVWAVKEGVHWKLGIGCECNAVVVCGMDVLEGIHSRLHVSRQGALCVGNKEGVNNCNVWTSHLDKPADAAHEALVSVSAVFLTLRINWCSHDDHSGV